MTPIEAAARALAKQQSGTDDFDALDEGLQETLRDAARAMLAAIREPSIAMVSAGWEADEANSTGSAMVENWQAMIDAALSEG